MLLQRIGNWKTITVIFILSELITVHILFDDILRIYVDYEDPNFVLKINAIFGKGNSKPARYATKSYSLSPAKDATKEILDNLVRKLNFQIFGNPCNPFMSSSDYRSAAKTLQSYHQPRLWKRQSHGDLSEAGHANP